jgi:hypothetical protein
MSIPQQPFDIAASTQELKNIDAELKRLRTFSNELRKRKSHIETKIQTYLQEHNHKGVVLGSVTVISETKNTKTNLPKDIKEQKMKDVLSQYTNIPDKVLYELQQISQGPTKSKQIITVHTDKKPDKK